MLRLPTLALVSLPLLLIGAPAQADLIHLKAFLTHDQETVQGPFLTSTGGPRPESFGFAEFLLDTSVPFMTMNVTVTNIDVTGTQTPLDTNDNLVAAHIHAGPTAVPGQNAPVRWGFFGAPDNDIAPSQLVVTPFATGVGGTFTSIWDADEGNPNPPPSVNRLETQLQFILNELSYINFHTGQFGGGEIRGVLLVPEPASLALLGLGLLGLAGLRRRPK